MHVGAWQVGLRTDDQAVAARLRVDLIGSIEETTTPSPGYAVVAVPVTESAPGSRPLSELRAGPKPLVRSRSAARLGLAAAHLVRTLGKATPGRLRISSAAIARGDRSVILPQPILWRPGLEARLRGRELVLVDTDAVEIDPDEDRLVAAGWDLDADERVDVDALVTVWLVSSDRLFARNADRPSTRLATAARHLAPGAAGDHQGDLERIGDLAALIRAVDDWPHDIGGLARLLESVLDH